MPASISKGRLEMKLTSQLTRLQAFDHTCWYGLGRTPQRQYPHMPDTDRNPANSATAGQAKR